MSLEPARLEPPVPVLPDLPRPKLVILQPTSVCNLNCSYCYLPDRRTPGLMSQEVLRAAATFMFSCDLRDKELEVLWHAGEPLTAGRDFYENAFALLAESAPRGVQVRHVIQTNGTLVDDRWCELFSRYNVSIGLSLDGPQELHDASRRTWGNRGSHAAAMRGLRALRAAGMEPGVICVLTRQSLAAPDQIFDFLMEQGIKAVAFNVDEAEGIHSRSSLAGQEGDVVDLYRKFIRRIWTRWCESGRELVIREFRNIFECIGELRRDGTFVRSPDEVVPLAILTIRRDGKLGTYSPELISTSSPRYDDFIVGDVLTDSPADVAHSAALRRLAGDIEEGRQQCATTCAYYSMCGAGFQSNRYAEHGSLQATETLTCRLHRKALVDELLNALVAETRQPHLVT